MVITQAEWPQDWEAAPTDQKYISRGRWLWIDNAEAPQEVVYGDATTRQPENTTEQANFPWLDVTFSLERLSEKYLLAALAADQQPSPWDKLQYSNEFGGSWALRGVLFTGVRLVPIIADAATGDKMAELLSSPGWQTASSGCRFKPLLSSDDLRLTGGLTKYSESAELVRGNSTWDSEGGSRPGEPSVMYSTRKIVEPPTNGFSVAAYSTPAVEMVDTVDWAGEMCSQIHPPANTVAEVIRFPNGNIAMLAESGAIAVLVM